MRAVRVITGCWISMAPSSFTLIEDGTLAIRLWEFNMDRDGTVDVVGNEVQEDDAINDRNRWGVRFQTLYTPNEDLTLRFIGDHSKVRIEICCAVGNWENNFFTQNPAPPNAIPGTDTTVAALDLAASEVQYLSARIFTIIKSAQASNLSHKIPTRVFPCRQTGRRIIFLITSISAYRKHESYDNIDADFYDIDALERVNDLTQEQYSQELRFSGDAFNDKVNYVTGLYYFRPDTRLNHRHHSRRGCVCPGQRFPGRKPSTGVSATGQFCKQCR